MQEVFENRQARVLCVVKSSDGRTALADALKTLGFSNIDSCTSCLDALKRLETETYDWIILPLDKGESVNALHIMDLVSRSPEHPGVKFSLLLEPDEVFVLPLAFELGLMSWHPGTFNRAGIAKEMSALVDRIAEYKGEVALVAAETLRELLMRENKTSELKTFLSSLFNIFPTSQIVLAWLAEAEFLVGNRETSRKAITTLKFWGSPLWQGLFAKYFTGEGELLPDIGIRDVVVVDADEVVLKNFSEVLPKCGVSQIRTFVDGQSAYDAIVQTPPDLVIQEWKLPKLSGPNLIQRLRQDGLHAVPVVVFSSLVGKQDLLLLQEMTVSDVIEKPFREEDVLNHIVKIVQQEKFPTQQRSLERRMLQELLLGNHKVAKEFRTKLESNESYPEAHRVYNSALFSFYGNDFDKARNGFLKAIQLGSDHLSCVNMLGKCFLKLRNFKDAIACFEKAAALSPKNIERMCAIAESHLSIGDADAAKLAVKAAENLDGGNAAVKHVAARVEVEVGDVRKASKLFASLGSLPALVADMNNSAVAMVRMKDFKGGIGLYEKTLAALPPKETGLRIRVTYNMVLAYVRMQELEKANELLKTIPENFISPIMGKVHKIQKKVRSALMQDRDVVLDTADDEALAQASPRDSQQGSDQSQAPKASKDGQVAEGEKATPSELSAEEMVKRVQEHIVFAKAGDRCCHMIFHSSDSMQSTARQLLANTPQLKTREAIKREEPFRMAHADKGS